MMLRHLVAIPLLLALAGTATAAPAGDGLKVDPDGETWSPWQARLTVVSPALPPLWTDGLAPTQPATALLAGDRYLGWGGLRATGGLLLGPSTRSLATPSGAGHGDALWRGTGTGATPADPDAPGVMPYLGLGYSAWWARTGLGVSADLGLAAQRPGQAVRFGRVVSGAEGFDDMLRAMQISPMLQVNLSYAF